ncbi:pickpocket protein 28-like [Planococcus citri]|uniref:pickpocket protein 28-like n=1 Tax=Planococcus citri TaxID=170843 RepID=UPI0031F98158
MVYVTYHRNYSRPTNNTQSFRRKLANNKAIKKKIKTIYHVTKNDLVETAHEYSQNSSLHGLRYVGNKDLHVIERLFWIISFTLASCASGYFINDLLQKWYEMPVIMSLSAKSTSLTTIPFPAITICNMNNVRKTMAEQILSTNDSILEQSLLEDFCEEDTLLESTMEDNNTSSWHQVQNFMVKVSQPCHEMIVSCKWHGEQQNCYEIFNSALTDEGMCCSFNKVKNDLIFRNPSHFSDVNITFPFTYVDWTPERGYPRDTPLNHIPWRPWGAGSHLGLTIVLNAELDEYYCSSEASHGFKATLHNPVETPKISAFGTLLRPGTETQVIISPIINLASLQLTKINQDKRQCFFSDEKVLRFYRTYTQRNCILECESNFTLYFCQCVMYYMPKDSTTRICGKQDIPCANRAKLAMETKLGWLYMNATKRNHNTQKPNCGCLPGCFSIIYEKKEFSSDISSKFKVKDPFYYRKNMAMVHFFFTDAQFTSIIKGELFGTTELLSGTGGLLGLFMGFSFLSVFEALYFATLRFWCSIRQKRKHVSEKIAASKITPKTLYPFYK